MYLNLQGLGRLESARIELGKSLLIFVGRNNTSKTYAAHTIYAVHRFGAAYLAESVHALVREQKLEQKLPQPSEVWHHELSIVDLLMPEVPRFIRGLGEHLRTQLPKIFATDDQFFSTTRVELQLDSNEEASIQERLLAQNLDFSFGVEDWQVSFRKPAGSESLSIDCQLIKPSGNGASKARFSWMPGAIAMPVTNLLLEVCYRAASIRSFCRPSAARSSCSAESYTATEAASSTTSTKVPWVPCLRSSRRPGSTRSPSGTSFSSSIECLARSTRFHRSRRSRLASRHCSGAPSCSTSPAT